MLIDPAETDWSTCSDSKVYHAAQDGVPQAKAELRRREAAHRMTPAVAAAVARKGKRGH